MLQASLTALATLVVSASFTPRVYAQTFPEGVLATGTMGPTNPPQPTLGTPINQSSMARLLTVNSIDDFCLFAPPTPQDIADSETIEVAWCTKERNNARLIPDGTLSGVSYLKTDFYVQVMGYGDLTKINIPAGDFGGELDPHGAYGSGNPIGGNVTSLINGKDENLAEWMLYIGNGQFCMRVCTNANSTYSAAAMCWHELDEVGCGFVMPGNYNFNGTFQSCDADVAYPPGWYPTATVNGTPVFSTFAQRYTGTANGVAYTIGDLTTPAGAYSTPSSSNCVTTSTVANGVDLASLGLSPAAATSTTGASGIRTSVTGTGTAVAASTGTPGSSSSSSGGAAGANVNAQMYPIITLWVLLSGIGAVVLFN